MVPLDFHIVLILLHLNLIYLTFLSLLSHNLSWRERSVTNNHVNTVTDVFVPDRQCCLSTWNDDLTFFALHRPLCVCYELWLGKAIISLLLLPHVHSFSRPNNRNSFDSDDDDRLVEFIAKYNPTLSGRQGNKLYQKLEDNVRFWKLFPRTRKTDS